MANVVVSKPSSSSSSSKRLSGKCSFKLGLPLLCGPSPASSPTPSPRRSPAPDRLDDLRRVFRHIDRDMDGKISSSELRAFFSSVSDDAAAADDLPSVGDDLDFAGFVALMETHRGGGGGGGGGEEEEVEDLRRAFEMFEAVKGSGRITPRGVQRVLSSLGDERSFADCEAMIRAYDINGDGELDFTEFHRMMSA
ncbi:putative calcium-binding protein [Ananas comosus]|uniref:Putative calcium-binding protein n=1 Tax=Ananas comosus TaxID=4615 RepID=A0A199W9L5_ANACO|nr:putative calcium-binding protein [Ananas comosus]